MVGYCSPRQYIEEQAVHVTELNSIFDLAREFHCAIVVGYAEREALDSDESDLCGMSSIISRRGSVLARATQDESILLTQVLQFPTIGIDNLPSAPDHFLQADRRPELYGLLSSVPNR